MCASKYLNNDKCCVSVTLTLPKNDSNTTIFVYLGTERRCVMFNNHSIPTFLCYVKHTYNVFGLTYWCLIKMFFITLMYRFIV